MKCRVVVEGNVQGVGYRSLVKQTARRMGIKGKVKNLEDGTVEIYCDAGKNEIEKFLKRIDKRGDEEDVFGLNVERISIFYEGEEGYIEPDKELGAFEIDYGEEAVSAFEKTNLERLEIGSLMLLGLGEKLGDKIDSGFNNLGVKIDSGFNNLGVKIDNVSDKIDNLGVKIDSGFNRTDENFNTLGERYDAVSKNLEAINRNISKLTEAILTLIKRTPKKRKGKGS